MRIGELARRSGLKATTIRFYESRGLLPEPPRDVSGYRSYADDSLEALCFIANARELGLPLDEIAGILGASSTAQVDCDEVVRRLGDQRGRLDEWIRAATDLRDVIDRTLERSDALRAQRGACCAVVEAAIAELAEHPAAGRFSLLPLVRHDHVSTE